MSLRDSDDAIKALNNLSSRISVNLDNLITELREMRKDMNNMENSLSSMLKYCDEIDKPSIRRSLESYFPSGADGLNVRCPADLGLLVPTRRGRIGKNAVKDINEKTDLLLININKVCLFQEVLGI